MIHFKTRRSIALNEALQTKAVRDGYSQIPIYTYMGDPYEDAVDLWSCEYVKSANMIRFDSPHNRTYQDSEIFPDVMYLVNENRDKYAELMGMNESQKQNITFHDAYNYGDIVISKQFEKCEAEVDWTDASMNVIYATTKYGLVRPLSDKARQVFVTRVLQKARDFM